MVAWNEPDVMPVHPWGGFTRRSTVKLLLPPRELTRTTRNDVNRSTRTT
jgi:hypothetical protein